MRESFVHEMVRKIKPVYMVIALGIVGAGLSLWLDIRGTDAAEILIVALLFLVVALVFEQWRELGLIRDDLLTDAACELCYDEEATLAALRALNKAAVRKTEVEKSHLRAVWGALFSHGFETFVKDQLASLKANDYLVERWVDISRVDEDRLLSHLEDSMSLLRSERYILHLVPSASFGAMVLDEEAAAINIRAHHSREVAIGIYAKDKMLAKMVRNLISELGDGLELPGANAATVPVEELLRQAKQYYEAHSPQSSE